VYGGEDNIPPLAQFVKAGYQPTYPPAGENTILREAALYFLPDGLRHEARRAWSRAARFLSPDQPGPSDPRTAGLQPGSDPFRAAAADV